MANRKLLAAAALTATLAGGGAIGATLGVPAISGAQDNPTITAPATTGSADQAPGMKGRGGGFGLDAAAKALGMTTDELRTELQDGKTIADVATAKKVDKQKVIDAMVADASARLDEAKAALPDQMAKIVDGTLPIGGRGGHGGPDGGFGFRGAGLDAAAKALGITADELRTELHDGKSIAEVATAKKVDKQKVIDALVAEGKTRLAEAVKSGKITQAQADERTKTLTDRVTEMVDRTGGFDRGPGGRHGHGGPDGDTAAGDEDTGGA